LGGTAGSAMSWNPVKSGCAVFTSSTIFFALASASAEIPTDEERITEPSGRMRETSTTATSTSP
jgi:hypothetical protein